ncbi:hypothetical protein BASA61_010034 [Batrachochytrium salamandrivorans]|nr:hypothetical protein BASA61_010034 [Batrachochytrium salamandrivorans]
MLLSISLISIAMFNAVVNAQYDDYNSGFQQSLQYNRPGYQRQPSYTPNTDASDECAQCKAAAIKFRIYPIGIWGSMLNYAMPSYAKPLWT